jgi:hypothetical protein
LSLSDSDSSLFISAECVTKIRDLQGDVIECPTCKLRTLLSREGIEGLTKNLDVLSAVFEAEKEQEQTCNFCATKVYPPKAARFFCTECSVYSCGSCSDEMHSQIDFRSHSICLASAQDKNAEESLAHDKRPSVSSASSLSKRRSSSQQIQKRSSSSLLDYGLLPGLFRDLLIHCTILKNNNNNNNYISKIKQQNNI